MKNYYIVDHPLVQNKLSYLRQMKTGQKEFRLLMEEITTHIVYEAIRDLTLVDTELETPVARARGKVITEKNAFIVVLRAGLGMMPGAIRLLPSAKVGHVGIYRDEDSLSPIHYYCKLPHDLENRNCIVLDPLLATGGTACEVVSLIKQEKAQKIKFIAIIASPDGLNNLLITHPDVKVYLAAVDKGLNASGYIYPGLGDAGDRLFGTL